jgi:tryptophan 2,3-dioxygenase
MLKVEQSEKTARSAGKPSEPFTYGDYLRVPELLNLQTLLSDPQAHDEMLFIVVQQIQELWFKQVLFELRAIIAALDDGNIHDAVRLLGRVNLMMRLIGDEVRVLETMPPQEFHEFRHVLTSSSGFESEQFRELELASGLNDATFLKLIEKHMDMEKLRGSWPRNLKDAAYSLLAGVDANVTAAVVKVYTEPRRYSELYMLCEALTEYEVLFSEWRFHHVKLVERTIGDRSVGTAGSTGAGYLGKTLGYRFFPELLEARNRMTASASERHGHPA